MSLNVFFFYFSFFHSNCFVSHLMWESKHLAFVSHEMVSVILKSVDSSKDDSFNGAGMMTGLRGPLWDLIMAMRIDSTSDSGMVEFLAHIK